MAKAFRGACRRLAALLLAALTALAALWFVGTDGNYHLSLHRKWAADQATGLTWKGVERAAYALADCLRTGDISFLMYEDQVFGQTQPVFNDREIAHMKDVVFLFQLLKKALICLSAGVLLLAALGMKGASVQDWGKAVLQGTTLFLLLMAGLVFLCALDFSRAFIVFHQLFFTNDLWLLDPATDLMIRLLPETFFFQAAARAALGAGLSSAALLGAGVVLALWRGKNKP